MGYMIPVLILNDATSNLETDPDVGKKIARAMSESGRPEYRDGKQCDFSIGNHCNGGSVLYSTHADDVQVVAFGGNCMTRIGTIWGAWREMTDPHALLKSLADTLGYRLVKKATRK